MWWLPFCLTNLGSAISGPMGYLRRLASLGLLTAIGPHPFHSRLEGVEIKREKSISGQIITDKVTWNESTSVLNFKLFIPSKTAAQGWA